MQTNLTKQSISQARSVNCVRLGTPQPLEIGQISNENFFVRMDRDGFLNYVTRLTTDVTPNEQDILTGGNAIFTEDVFLPIPFIVSTPGEYRVWMIFFDSNGNNKSEISYITAVISSGGSSS